MDIPQFDSNNPATFGGSGNLILPDIGVSNLSGTASGFVLSIEYPSQVSVISTANGPIWLDDSVNNIVTTTFTGLLLS